MTNTLFINGLVFTYSSLEPLEIGVTNPCKETPQDATFTLQQVKLISQNKSNGFLPFSEIQIQEISQTIKKHIHNFNTERQKRYLSKPSHIQELPQKERKRILRENFITQPSFDLSNKLWLLLLKYHKDHEFNREFVQEAFLSDRIDKHELEKWNKEDEEEYHSEHKQNKTGWDTLGSKIKKIHFIEGLQNIFIVESISDGIEIKHYIFLGPEGIQRFYVPGEFTGTDDFLFVQ